MFPVSALSSTSKQRLQDHYISPGASHGEIVKAAKLMRTESHLGRLQRQGGLSNKQTEGLAR